MGRIKRGALLLILRGAIGGASAGLLWLTMVSAVIYSGRIWYSPYFFLGLVQAGLLGLFTGVLIGLVIWLLNAFTKKHPGMAGRAFIGLIFGFVVNRLYSLSTPDYSMFISWKTRFAYLITFAVIVGALTGIIVGRQQRNSA